MSTEVLKCRHCSALRADATAATCAYCGATFAERAPDPAPEPPPTAWATLQQRLKRLAAEPQVRAYLQAPVPKPVDSGFPSVGLAFGIAALVLLGLGLANSASRGNHGAGVLPVGLGVVLVVALARRRKRRRALRDSRPERRCAAIVGKRIETSDRERTRTRYFVTLEFADGSRREYGLEGKAFALCAEDDLGVADTVGEGGGWLTNFRRFPGA